MDDMIRVNEQWYVNASSSRADARTRVLKHGESFALFDRLGDILPVGLGEQGLYHEGTRYLSRLELDVDGQQPVLLNSAVSRDNQRFSVDQTLASTPHIAEDTVHLRRTKTLWHGVLYERITAKNYGNDTITLRLGMTLDGDYADIFEVRGNTRPQRGTGLEPSYGEREVCLGYHGLDARLRHTRVRFDRAPQSVEPHEAGHRLVFVLTLSPHQSQALTITVACDTDDTRQQVHDFDAVMQAHETRKDRDYALIGALYSDNEQFNEWLNRSAADLHMLVSETSHGPYPYAGVPWFSTAFGRDGLITALQTLWLAPDLARGVLGYLAATQSTTENVGKDATPGKILHETRDGEMARLGEVPFRHYYGSIDSTPLFVVLAEAYYARTGDRDFIENLWPAIEQALAWIDQHGDIDSDGFIEYEASRHGGLIQQGWKDSADSVFNADGSDATGPIALCEVQGYVYAAKLGAARLAHLLGLTHQAEQLQAQAERLRQRFDEAFWCDDIGSYALALDGNKRPCKIRSSNAGHALWSGIALPSRAARLAETLLNDKSFNGFGIRTVAEGEARFNPMAYHNGSIWPHDNAMIAQGLARYGQHAAAVRVITGLFDAAMHMEDFRLPELFCGFAREPGQGPTRYPVACSPQAWAAGAVFHLLQACLGLHFSADAPRLRFDHPLLPTWINTLEIRSLRVGHAVLDLALARHENDVSVNVKRKQGDIQVSVLV
ncbi:amylo-alpha-1,6-glucosidase [Modicisalibacter luteus]|uniref:Glycogen debranching N-terminal domain-containing protein n=1 Tax=Modicisalibacter luteus TaxID=453962 RepID=A0ABV7M0L7_9GAMM|nr:amylo-alpha-1,6-glucosidase [Halomonas lutea]GHA96873.1 amylo-alpha-1,6-glucosidase [Halomonas lutea]